MFLNNNQIQNTTSGALIGLHNNAVETVIAAATTPVLIAGVWSMEQASQFTADVNGRIVFGGGKTSVFPISVSLAIEPAAGGDRAVSMVLFLNGVVVTNSQMKATAKAGDPTSITVTWALQFDPADYVEVFITNEETTDNLIVTNAQFRIN